MDESTQMDKAKLVAMLKELAELQATNMKLQTAIFARKSKDIINEKIKSFIDTMRDSAKEYGNKAKELVEELNEEYINGKAEENNVMSRYQEILERINAEYDNVIMQTLADKHRYETMEMYYWDLEYDLSERQKEEKREGNIGKLKAEQKKLKKEAIVATARGDIETAKQKLQDLEELEHDNPILDIKDELAEIREKRKECREAIRYCNDLMKEFQENKKEKMRNVMLEANEMLMPIDKKTAFRRILGGILNKIGGANKFKNYVISSISNKIENFISTDLPVIQAEMDEKRTQITERKNSIIESTKETIQTSSIVQKRKRIYSNRKRNLQRSYTKRKNG